MSHAYRESARALPPGPPARFPWGALLAWLLLLGGFISAGVAAVGVDLASMFSAPSASSLLPLFPSLIANVVAWMLWQKCYRRRLTFDVPHGLFVCASLLCLAVVAGATYSFVDRTVHPPAPLDLSGVFTFGGC